MRMGWRVGRVRVQARSASECIVLRSLIRHASGEFTRWRFGLPFRSPIVPRVVYRAIGHAAEAAPILMKMGACGRPRPVGAPLVGARFVSHRPLTLGDRAPTANHRPEFSGQLEAPAIGRPSTLQDQYAEPRRASSAGRPRSYIHNGESAGDRLFVNLAVGARFTGGSLPPPALGASKKRRTDPIVIGPREEADRTRADPKKNARTDPIGASLKRESRAAPTKRQHGKREQTNPIPESSVSMQRVLCKCLTGRTAGRRSKVFGANGPKFGRDGGKDVGARNRRLSARTDPIRPSCVERG
ncbi:hypothetical protein BSF38_04670 [Paludisphaera borealis]|uniref:Uncharacterized protein n=1 Tax=Paludisphaera borealis TaxID=1387353 RepID=A0A1U7CW42_9BACT|nr:hypothetical protein BSF38_04670 [Paludisphaera borealis]